MPKDLPYDIIKLLKDLANSDEQTFRLVLDHYKAPFHSTAFKMTRSEDIAEEIIQEVFVTIWMKRKLVADSEKPEGYLFTILHNSIYSHFRKLAQERRLEFKLDQQREDSYNNIETLLIEKEDRATLENVINQLPPQQSLIYKLAKQEGISREAIASQLEISPNTVRNHLAAAVERLRTCLKKSVSASILLFSWIHL
jgi:RNA polymerase sigma factor (sigma-70 family)